MEFYEEYTKIVQHCNQKKKEPERQGASIKKFSLLRPTEFVYSDKTVSLDAKQYKLNEGIQE